MAKYALKCKKMFDALNEKVLEDVIILVEDNKIAEVLSDNNIPEGYEVIDMGDKFVTPGLIDCHMHLAGNGESSGLSIRPYQTIGKAAYRALNNVRDDMMAGFTSIRSCGDMGYIDVALRDSINAGEHWGPRLMVPGQSLGSTGGHSDSHYNPYIKEIMGKETIGDGPAEMMKCVRTNIKHGADYIKFMATGGVMSLGTTVGAQQMSYEEMKAICDTAKMYGCIIATHAHGTSGIKDAIRAGVTSVEHGMIMDEECIQLMKEMGTYLVPTIIAAKSIVENGAKIGTPQWAIDKANQVLSSHQWGFTRCMEEGIPIAFGSDAATPNNFHGKQTKEFEYLVEFGMSPLQALTAATKTASELMRKSEQVGSITKGKFADIAAFDGDPREDITAMNRCVFVMKDGVVYKG